MVVIRWEDSFVKVVMISLIRVQVRPPSLLTNEGIFDVAMKSVPSKSFRGSVNASLDTVPGICVSWFASPPTVFVSPVGDDGSVIQPHKIRAALCQSATADPRCTATQG